LIKRIRSRLKKKKINGRVSIKIVEADDGREVFEVSDFDHLFFSFFFFFFTTVMAFSLSFSFAVASHN
jgi:hypothetical protein